MANVGDIVVFKHHVCTIAQKRENYFDGKAYWELHAVFEKSLKLFIACDAAKSPAMRPVMQKQEAIDLIDSIADAKPVNLEDDAAATAKTSSLQQRPNQRGIRIVSQNVVTKRPCADYQNMP